MIAKILTSFTDGFTYIKKHPQLLMTLLLIVIIPVAFLFSGQQFLEAGRENQERLERERIGLLQDLFVSVLTTSGYNEEIIQQEILKITELNPDIREFRILKESGNDITIIASLTEEEISKVVENPRIYTIANSRPDETIISRDIQDNQRFWLSTRLSRSENNENFYIYTRTSLEHIDTLFSDKIKTAYYWLIGILIVIIFLVIRHVRLIDYSYLYSETKKANEMKDLFTNMIAHELRTPLTSMRGYASLIREKDSATDEIKGFAERIEESSGRLLLIVNDLLDVARIQSGRLSIKSEKVNIKKLIDSVLEAQVFLAKEKNIKIISEDIKDDIYIQGDEKRLYQAFTNLVSNSVKYTKSGTISLNVDEKHDRIEVRVKDTGMGMSAENQKNLFAPFFRIETIETKEVVGTGLGMWITKQLIELMQGSIAVESIKGVGTHIVVTLPK